MKGIINKKNNLIYYLVIINILTLSISQCNAISNPSEDTSSLIYGFILPTIKFDNKSLENEIFCKIRHVVNDLLREDIPVHWTTTDTILKVSEIDNFDIIYELLFEKSSFVIPFTGNNTIDTKIIAIICDYNQSSEIEEKNSLKIPVYLLREQNCIKSIKLYKVKIIELSEFFTCGGGWYSSVASKCGFLDFVVINNIIKKFDYNNYNLLIWPGYDLYYPSDYSYLESILGVYSFRNRAIRNFVSNGGGFVGSCYGIWMAGRGVKNVFINPIKAIKNSNYPSIGFLSISDIIIDEKEAKCYLSGLDLQQQIIDTDNPVTYGLNSNLTGGFLLGGPKMSYTGENIDIIAYFKNNSYLNNTPSIVSNKFFDGKVVLFSPHPEISDQDISPKFWDGAIEGANNKKLITNAFFYATSKDEMEQVFLESRPISFINEVWNITKDLNNLLNDQTEIFGQIKTNINKSIEDVVNIKNRINLILFKIKDIAKQIADEKGITIEEAKRLVYFGGTIYNLFPLDVIKEYLENTSITIQMIEKIYPILEKDTAFIEEIEKLKSDLSLKISKIKETVSMSLNNIEKMEKIIDIYKNYKFLKNICLKKFKKTSHCIEDQTEIAFHYMPEGFFNTLKFLRHYWYSFETTLSMKYKSFL